MKLKNSWHRICNNTMAKGEFNMASCIVFVLFGGMTFATSGCYHQIHHEDELIVPHKVVFTSHIPYHYRVDRVRPSRVYWRHQNVRYRRHHKMHRRNHHRVRYHSKVKSPRRHHYKRKLRKRTVTRRYDKKGNLRKRVVQRRYR